MPGAKGFIPAPSSAELDRHSRELTARYEAATICEALTELNQKMGTSPKTEYDRLARVANELRLKSEQPRLTLHRGGHCF